MDKKITYYASRKNPLVWIAALLLTLSVVCRIAFFCGGKDADTKMVWFQLILPVASGLLYTTILLVRGKEHLYRTAIPVALWLCCFPVNLAPYLSSAMLVVLTAVGALTMLVIYNVTLVGKVRHTWLLVLLLAAIIAGAIRGFRADLRAGALLRPLSEICLPAGFFAAVLGMQPHLDGAYHPTWGDRADGRRVRTLAPITYIAPFIMPNRNGASNSIHASVEITAIERYIHAKRREGLSNFGITHVFLAAYVRTVAQYPALNRFLAGQRIYSRDEDIQFSMIVKKNMTVEAPDTAIKLHLRPEDTAYTVYEKFNAAVEQVKNAGEDSTFDRVAHLLTLLPGLVLKFAIWVLKCMDYFGLIPGFLLEVSPFHGSVFFTSLGSLGIPPVVHHLYDFGNLPAFCAFGCKRRENQLQPDGTVLSKKYVDYTMNLDERTVDGFYYAMAQKAFDKALRHPERLDTPPETVLRDVD